MDREKFEPSEFIKRTLSYWRKSWNTDTMTYTCDHCDVENPKPTNFCPYCGSRMIVLKNSATKSWSYIDGPRENRIEIYA